MNKPVIFSLPVIILFLLSFLLGTSEFVVVGILPEIADGLEVSLSIAGTSVSAFAFAYAIGTPFFSAYAGQHERRRFMFICTILFIIFNALCGLAANYMSFISCRIVLAILSGTILSLSMTSANDIANDSNRGKIVSMVFTGFSAASVFGVPLASSLSHLFGWRAVFIIIAVATVLILPFMYRVIPEGKKERKTTVLGQLRLFRNRQILLGILIVIFTAGASYTFYTYLNPILQQRIGMRESFLSMALMFYGFAALLSNVLSGRIAEKWKLSQIHPVFLIQAIFLAALAFCGRSAVFGGLDIIVLGILMYVINSPSQLFFLSVTSEELPDCISLASCLSPVCFNLGIAMGSLTGGIVMDFLGLDFLGPAGAIIAIFAVMTCLALKKDRLNALEEERK